jgi:hypothetical protein
MIFTMFSDKRGLDAHAQDATAEELAEFIKTTARDGRDRLPLIKLALERRYPATVDGTAGGEPVLFSKERLAETRQRMGPYTFAAQFLLDPAAERDQAFHDDWLRYFDIDEGNTDEMQKYILVDPASSKKKGSDYTVMVVIGLGTDQNYYLLDAVRDRLNLTERCAALFTLHRKWRPERVG